jgi:hypothetical protein
MRLCLRICLLALRGILTAAAVGVGGILLCLAPFLFTRPAVPSDENSPLPVGIAIVLTCAPMMFSPAVIVLIPIVFIVFILDQSSEQFRTAPGRALYGGVIGLAVILGWTALFCGGPVPRPFHPIWLTLPIAGFLAGATFTKIVTFPRLGKLRSSL